MRRSEILEAAPPQKRRKVLDRFIRDLGPLRLLYTPGYPEPKQEVFLRLTCAEAFYGGAAGPGKSWALLAAALQYVDVPGYDALILRKTFPELTQSGGLIPMAHEWLDTSDAVWNEQRHEWKFPSGATVTFGHLQTKEAIRRYFGGERHYVGVDESTGFTWSEIRRLNRVLRRPSKTASLRAAPDGTTAADVPLRLRLGSNPGSVGHAWHRRRYVKKKTRAPGVVYVPARLRDNPHLDLDTYLPRLRELDPIDQARLIDGDWDVVEAGTVYNQLWLKLEQSAPAMRQTVRRWDLAATEQRGTATEVTDEGEMAGGDDPDFTVGLLYGRDRRSEFWILDVVRGQWHAGDVERIIQATAERDGKATAIGINQDPGQAGKSQIRNYARDVLPGYNVRGFRETGPKETRARITAAAAANGLVHVLEGAWTEDFLDEVQAFPEGHDDQVDAWTGAHDQLTGRVKATTAVPTGRI